MDILLQKTNNGDPFLVIKCMCVQLLQINATIIVSQTGEEFEAEYAARLGAERYRDMNLTDFILSGSLYDAMWAIAIGLHNASVHVARNDSIGCDQKSGKLVPLEDFDYDNEKIGCVLLKSFSQASFRGVTVR